MVPIGPAKYQAQQVSMNIACWGSARNKPHRVSSSKKGNQSHRDGQGCTAGGQQVNEKNARGGKIQTKESQRKKVGSKKSGVAESVISKETCIDAMMEKKKWDSGADKTRYC